MTRLYSTFDEPSLGADLALSETDHVLQVSTTCNPHRMARSTIAITAASAINFFAWSPSGSPPALTPTAGVPPLLEGICTAAAAANKFLGEDAHGLGFCRGDGKVYSNNAVLVDLGVTVALGKNVQWTVLPDDTATIRVDGVQIGATFDIPAGQEWFYAATVSGDVGQLAVEANPGDTPMPYPPGDLGWWAPSGTIAPILASTEPYITAPDDVVPHEKYDGVIDRAQNPIAISVGIRYWMMGQSAPAELGSGGLVQVQFNDPNGRYVRLRNANAKGKRVPLLRVPLYSAIATAEPVYVGVLDHAELASPQIWNVYLRDKMSLLAVPLERELFPPTADPSVAGKYRPALIGIARTFTAELEDAPTRRYAMGDRVTTAFGRVRVAGKQKVYGTDFEETTDGRGVTFDADTDGRPTFEATSFGGSFDPVAPDYITAQGDFTTCGFDATYFVPDGWTNPEATDTDMTVTERFFIDTTSDQFLKCVSQPGLIVRQKLDTPLLQARRTYAYKLDVRNVPFYSDHTFDGTVQPPARLYLTPHNDRAGLYALGRYAEFPLTHIGVYSGVFTVESDADQPLCIVVVFNDIYYFITDAMAFNFLGIRSIVINELPAVTDNVVLDGPGLDGMIRGTMVDRGPVDLAEYATADAQAIDAVTGFVYGVRVRSSESPNIDELLKLYLDSTTAAMFNDESGDYRVVRASKPEDVADGDLDGTLVYPTDFKTPLLPVDDDAEELTTSASGCRNYDPLTASEYGSTSLSDTPLAVRALLAADYQWTVTSRVRLAPRYAKAYGRDPIKTSLDRKEHGQAFIDHACGLYAIDRAFYIGEVFEPFGRPLRIGGVYQITYRGFLDGVLQTIWVKKLVLLGFSPKKPSEQSANCIFWGAA
jgi:hypothetical protein